MKFTMRVNCDNAAFAEDPNGELARILREVARQVEEDGRSSNSIRDLNGNLVGHWGVGQKERNAHT